MPPRLPHKRVPPIGFAHRGARAHAPENTLAAFELAVRLGARAIESDVWLTRDGVPVLDHDGRIGSRLRPKAIRDVDAADLPAHIPTVAQVLDAVGTEVDVSLDLKDADAGPATLEVAMAADPTMPSRLWMCHHDHDRLVALREVSPHVRLVDSTRLHRIKEGPERRAATLADLGIDAINLHHSDWNGGLTTLFHRFGLHAFGWDAQFDRTLDELLRMGIDAVYSDHVPRMVEALERNAQVRGIDGDDAVPDVG